MVIILIFDYFDCLTHETGAPLRVQKFLEISPPPTLFDIPKTLIALPPRCYEAICPILSALMVLNHHTIHPYHHQSILLLKKKQLIGNQKQVTYKLFSINILRCIFGHLFYTSSNIVQFHPAKVSIYACKSVNQTLKKCQITP